MVNLTGRIDYEAFKEAEKIADALISYYLPRLYGKVVYVLRRSHGSAHFHIKPKEMVEGDIGGVLRFCERSADSVFRSSWNPNALYRKVLPDYSLRLPKAITAPSSSV